MRVPRQFVLFLALVAPGCFRVEIYAPHGPPVSLLSAEEPAAVTRQQRIWFGVAGAVPIDDTQPAEIMARENLREVRVAVTDTIPDALIALFQNVIVQTGLLVQTYRVEGNRPADDRAGWQKPPDASAASDTKAVDANPANAGPPGAKPEDSREAPVEKPSMDERPPGNKPAQEKAPE